MAGRKRLLVVVQVVATIAALGVLLSIVDRRKLFLVLGEADAGWLTVALLLTVNAVALAGIKIRLLMRIAGFQRSLSRCWMAVLRGVAMNLLLPGRGGDVAKVFYLRDGDEPTGPLFAAAVTERVLDVSGLAALALAASIYAQWPTGVWIASVIVASALAGFALVFSSAGWRAIPRSLQQTAERMRDILRSSATLFKACPLALLTWINNAAILWVLIRAVQARVDPAMAAAAAPVAILLGMVPLSVGGMGTREAALVWLLRGMGDREAVFAAGLLYSAFAYWFLGALGIAASGWHLAVLGVDETPSKRSGGAT